MNRMRCIFHASGGGRAPLKCGEDAVERALTRGSPASAVGLALSRRTAGEGGADGTDAEGEGTYYR